MAAMFEKTVAMPVKYEMLYVGQWRQNLLLADRYGEGRVFLAGDAVHLVIPTGGLGMNTGVGDAIDLSGSSPRTLQGWGGPNLLRVLRDRAAADRRAQRRGLALRLARPAQVARGLSAEHPRRHAGGRSHPREPRAHRRRRAAQEQRDDRRRARLSLCRLAADLAGAGRGARAQFMDYVPTTWPGARLPHVWLDDGTRDAGPHRLRHGYTLLRLGGTRADTAALERAFGDIGAPLQVLDVAGRGARATSTATISCCCGPTCTWSGAATASPTSPRSPRSRRGIAAPHCRSVGWAKPRSGVPTSSRTNKKAWARP